MPAPKGRGTIPVSQGIVHNNKFNFWMVQRSFNTINVQDTHEFFNSKEEAEERYKVLNQPVL